MITQSRWLHRESIGVHHMKVFIVYSGVGIISATIGLHWWQAGIMIFSVIAAEMILGQWEKA